MKKIKLAELIKNEKGLMKFRFEIKRILIYAKHQKKQKMFYYLHKKCENYDFDFYCHIYKIINLKNILIKI
jgi:hypothetical protein